MGKTAIRIRWTLNEEALLKLQAETLPGDVALALNPLERDWWIATMDREPVGFVCLKQFNGLAYIELVGVSPRARGHGLQRRLMSVALRYAKHNGCQLAISYTAPWNHASSNNFIATGWKLYTPEYKWGWEDALYWKKNL